MMPNINTAFKILLLSSYFYSTYAIAMKHLHLLFVTLVIVSFIWRVYLAEKKPELLAEKWLKILPHGLATGLLLSGVVLVVQGNWLSTSYAWIVGKLFLMLVFIGLGIFTMREQGQRRWIFFAGAIFCFAYIIKVAFAKQFLFFL
jgi:uncharacterized membrane protein SirB2